MLLHTILRSDAGLLAALFGRPSSDLQSDDDIAELLLLQQTTSSRIANNCNRSTLMFTRLQ